jgi:membrane protease YdiL (CAAX protease family)
VARRPWFWIVFAALGLGGALTATQLFSVALPNISIAITMDRGEALAHAAALAEEYGWGAADDRSAASFGLVDPEVQMYVELEGGGREAFAHLSERGLHEPYQWQVRRFAERRVEEVRLTFTPSGDPYGFRLRLSENDAAGGNMDPAVARTLAEATAVEWGVEMQAYRLLESSQETFPGGRVDHALVYERGDEMLVEARFRLRLEVAGSRVSELTRFVYVPEAFSRRYADVRATNDAIALVAQSVFMLLFVLLGAGVGSALLLRRRWLEWRAPLLWGAVIAFLFGLNTINQLPLSWMSYDTAVSASRFVLQQLGASVAIGLLGTPLVAFFLLAAESLGRRAFAGHLQQWRFWSPEVASSTTALGMTLAAYLLVGLQLGYVVLFYLGTQRLEGWWSPADALVQPDLLATYLPWLQAVSTSLFASFWEESVFRAVPIACAALLGARFGRVGLWVWGAVLLQAVVFAAAHANYPQQPPYARVVELTAPALLWGIVYVRYGLVPTILAHFLYDLSLFSLVLFESDALVDQAVIVGVALAPLAVVLVVRQRAGARARPPDWALNGAWTPAADRSGTLEVGHAERRPAAVGLDTSAPLAAGDARARVGPAPEAAPPTTRGPATSGGQTAHAATRWILPRWAVPVLGGSGALLWLATQLVAPPPPRLWGDSGAARGAAGAELEARGIDVEAWSSYVTAGAGSTEGRGYVYDEAGPEAYAELVGTYFDAPRWLVRFLRWDADPEARVEEYRVWVGDGGEVERVWHVLPEASYGTSLEVEAARTVAVGTATQRLGIDATRLREVEAEETSRPNRTDWTFSFTELGLLEDVQGEARVRVQVAGDEVIDVARTVRVPEEWVRARRDTESLRTMMAGGLLVLLTVGFGAAAIAGVIAWSRGALAAGVAVRIALPVLAALALSALNSLPVTYAALSTAQPLGLQMAAAVVALVLAALVAAPAIGLVGGLAATWSELSGSARSPRGAAVALGLLVAGLAAAVQAALPSPPRLPDYAGAASHLPWLDAPLGLVTPYFLVTSALLMALAARARFRHRHVVQSALLTLLAVGAVVVVPAPLQASVALWGLAALAMSVLLLVALHVLAADPILVPGVVGTVAALGSLTLAVDAPYEGARVGGVLAGIAAGAAAWATVRLLGEPRRRAPDPAHPDEEMRAPVGSV